MYSSNLDFNSLYPFSLSDTSLYMTYLSMWDFEKVPLSYFKVWVKMASTIDMHNINDNYREVEVIIDMHNRVATVYDDVGEYALREALIGKNRDIFSFHQLIEMSVVAGILCEDGRVKCLKNRRGVLDDKFVEDKLLPEKMELEYAIKTGKSPKQVKLDYVSRKCM